MTTGKPESCPMCIQTHTLYRYEVFKSKSSKERNDFVKQGRFASIVLIQLKTTQGRVQGCGKSHHTFLHFMEPRQRVNQQIVTQNNDVVNQDLVPDYGTASTCSTTSAVNSCEVLLQVIPLKVMQQWQSNHNL